MIWDNRGFKNFPTEVRDYFKLQRHYKHVVILASQTFDVDKKIRDLADDRKFTYIPKYTKYFDSFGTPIMKEKVFEKVPELKIPVRGTRFNILSRLRYRKH